MNNKYNNKKCYDVILGYMLSFKFGLCKYITVYISSEFKVI